MRILHSPLAQNLAVQIAHSDSGRRILQDRRLCCAHENTAYLGQIHVFVGVNAHVAGPPDIVPLADVTALRIEELDALILPVGDIDRALTVHADVVRCDELPGAGPWFAPGIQKVALGREVVYACVAVTIRDVKGAVRGERDSGWVVEWPPGAQNLLLNIPNVPSVCRIVCRFD